MFEMGDRVKCINAKWPERENASGAIELERPNPLEEGIVYTVTSVYCQGAYRSDGVYDEKALILQLEEVINPYVASNGLDGFCALRFKKAFDISESLSELVSMFEPVRQLETT